MSIGGIDIDSGILKKNEISKLVKVFCLTCGGEIKHKILIELSKTEEDKYDKLYSEYSLLECINCESITYRTDYYTSEDMIRIPTGPGDDDCEWDRLTYPTYYPTRDKELAQTNNIVKLLPETIQDTFKEVVTAINHKLEILSGLGLRTLLEQICKHFIDDNDLGKILDSFEEKGFISTKQRALLDDIRYIGNDSAHRAEMTNIGKHKLNLSVLINLIQLLFAYYKYEKPTKITDIQSLLKPSPRGEIPKVRDTTRVRIVRKKL